MMLRETQFPKPWMIWSICWISRRTLHSVVLMISSTTQPLLRKTCGLFDNGFAGDVDFITSSEVNASSDALSAFGLDSQNYSQNPGVSGFKDNSEQLKSVHGWNVLNDLDDMSDDPLGDDSMEAFINLDQFLNENSFFDEEGNLTVPDDNLTVPDTEMEVKPVISFVPEQEDVSVIPNFLSMEDVPVTVTPVITTKSTGKPKRKRPVRSTNGVKTSLFEIPALSSSVVADANECKLTPLDSELDHDYSAKHQKMSSPSRKVPTDTVKAAAGSDPLPGTIGQMAECQWDASMDKQTIRRIKNNVASKRSREQRKQKFLDMDEEAEELSVKNQNLREKIVELERLAREMKEVLVAKMAGKS